MSSPTSAMQVLRRLELHPPLAASLEFDKIQRFLDLVKRLWPEIVQPQCPRPLSLPPHIIGLLSSVLKLEPSIVQLCWLAFGDLGEYYHEEEHPSIDDEFRLHGMDHKLGQSVYLMTYVYLNYN